MGSHYLGLGVVCVLGAAAVFGGLAAAQELDFEGFPFQMPYKGPAQDTAPALLAGLPAPAGAEGFVQVEGERFVLSESGNEVRFWGTNLSIGGCFPTHDVADRMARRMGSLGINCVRMHFIDAAGFPQGIWQGEGWLNFPHTSFHPDSLDRLDYLIARLKENGVYTDINLHVARTWGPEDGFPAVGEGESLPGLGKGVSLFYPRCIEEQKRYARMLMRHVNAYTGWSRSRTRTGSSAPTSARAARWTTCPAPTWRSWSGSGTSGSGTSTPRRASCARRGPQARLSAATRTCWKRPAPPRASRWRGRRRPSSPRRGDQRANCCAP
ncbi:MAG: hypothetical protein AMK73_09670 [Planctomycetes bacterium SM23_32]|nr:MAG: hypothetical protein AMK73_09670 [Planctomycetes bacterium SM23_32]